MVDRNSIMSYDVCTCGAITLYLSNKTQVSLKRKNLKKFGLSLKGIAKETRGKLINCNHCINHWGIDLCSCGSGLTPEKCCEKEEMEVYFVEVGSCYNPDNLYREGGIKKEIPKKKIKVHSIFEARKKVLKFIQDNDLGGGDWGNCGDLFNQKFEKIGYISYNGVIKFI